MTDPDGSTGKDADKIAETFSSADCAVETCEIARCTVEVCDIACSKPERSLEDYDRAIARGPLHSGKHSPRVVTFSTCDETKSCSIKRK